MTTEKQTAAETTSIDYIAYNVEKRGKKTYWTRVGVAFKPHEDGEGFTANLSAIPLSGAIVFRKPKAADEEAGQKYPVMSAACRPYPELRQEILRLFQNSPHCRSVGLTISTLLPSRVKSALPGLRPPPPASPPTSCVAEAFRVGNSSYSSREDNTIPPVAFIPRKIDKPM